MFFRMVYKSGQIFLPFCHNTRVWQTDGRTDRWTDGRTEFSSQYRVKNLHFYNSVSDPMTTMLLSVIMKQNSWNSIKCITFFLVVVNTSCYKYRKVWLSCYTL